MEKRKKEEERRKRRRGWKGEEWRKSERNDVEEGREGRGEGEEA